ncbi:MAG: NAAT family transporter [Planctomycetes bacterium]|nr:NAAT family transporter [Planctomycetota bacterium]
MSLLFVFVTTSASLFKFTSNRRRAPPRRLRPGIPNRASSIDHPPRSRTRPPLCSSHRSPPMLPWPEYLKFLISVLVIIDPPGVVPMFLSATADQNRIQRRRTARVAAMSVALILIVVAIGGGPVLEYLGIRIAAFRIAGGILLLLMGISMLHARVSPAVQTPEEAREAELADDVAVVPLAIPLLAGPGAISAVVIYSLREQTWMHIAVICGVLVIVAIITWLVLRLATAIEPMISRTGLKVVTRLFGLILAAIAVEFMVQGLLEVFPALGSPP